MVGKEDSRNEFCVERNHIPFVYDMRCTPIIRNHVEVGRLCVLRDISKRKELEKELQEMALTDSLTGLNNRRQFYQLAIQEFERASRYHSPFSLLMIDIDDLTGK